MKKKILIHGVLILLLLFLAISSLFVGDFAITINDVLNQKLTEVGYKIFYLHRLPRIVTVILVGIAMPLSGMLMQTLFKNPLAGPSILGISSLSNLFVAFSIYSAGTLGFVFTYFNSYRIAFAALLGALIGSFLILMVSYRVKSKSSLLLTGVMLSGLATTLIALLKFLGSKEELKTFLFWSFGSVDVVSWESIGVMSILIFIGLVLTLPIIKSLNALLLGEAYAQTMGVNLNRTKQILIVIVTLLTGAITAFCGPIAFVGLVVPYLARILYKTANHSVLVFGTILLGICSMLIVQLLTHILPQGLLPINIVTSLIGVPIILYILICQKSNL